MKNNILVDTSIWIDFFRQDSDIGSRLVRLLSDETVYNCGIVLFELLQGIKSETEKAEIQSAIAGLPYAEMSPLLWGRAAELSRTLKKTVSQSLCLIFLSHQLPLNTTSQFSQ